MKEEAKFHWAEGIKLATEAIKMIFLLNGAATISVITFIGNLKQRSDPLVCAMQLFAVGAALAPAALVLGYFTQLQYGNAEHNLDPVKTWRRASIVHSLVYVPVIISWVLFLAGARYAAIGFGALSF
jgi:multisubunit Na+/H+ antiporter MnhC subunit